jgi:hypothetical protein
MSSSTLRTAAKIRPALLFACKHPLPPHLRPKRRHSLACAVQTAIASFSAALLAVLLFCSSRGFIISRERVKDHQSFGEECPGEIKRVILCQRKRVIQDVSEFAFFCCDKGILGVSVNRSGRIIDLWLRSRDFVYLGYLLAVVKDCHQGRTSRRHNDMAFLYIHGYHFYWKSFERRNTTSGLQSRVGG